MGTRGTSLSALLAASSAFPAQSRWGCVCSLFQFLEGLPLCIPDTLVFQGAYLEAWYYTTEQGKGVVERVGGEAFNGALVSEVLAAFGRRVPAGGVAGLWVELGYQDLSYKGKSRTARKAAAGKGLALKPEYLTLEAVRARLCAGSAGAPAQGFAILQRFVPPKGAFNHTLTTRWSPQRGLWGVEQSSAQCAMLDASGTLEARLDTEGEGCAREALASPLLRASLQRVLAALADGLAGATTHLCRLEELEGKWRTGEDGLLYFLFASTCLCESFTPEDRAIALGKRVANEAGALHEAGESQFTASSATLLLGLGVSGCSGGGSGGGGAAAGSPSLSLRTRPPRPFTAALAVEEDTRASGGPLGSPSASLRSLNADLALAIEEKNAEKKAAAAAAAARAALLQTARERRDAVRFDLALIHRCFDAATQCPACGEGLEEGWTDISQPPTKGRSLPFRSVIAYHDNVLYAMGREAFNDSVQSSLWKGRAFDGPAAVAMAPEPNNFLPLFPALSAITGGGVGFYGAMVLAVRPAPGPPPPRRVRASAAARSVFHHVLPIPEFKVATVALRAAQAARLERRRAEEEAAAAEAQTDGALAVLAFMQEQRKLTPVPEVPPPLTLVSGGTIDALSLRSGRQDLLFTSRTLNVCDRCAAILSSVAAVTPEERRAGGVGRALKGAISEHSARLGMYKAAQEEAARGSVQREKEAQRLWRLESSGRASSAGSSSSRGGAHISPSGGGGDGGLSSRLSSAKSPLGNPGFRGAGGGGIFAALIEEACPREETPPPPPLAMPELDSTTRAMLDKDLTSGRSLARIQSEAEQGHLEHFHACIADSVAGLGANARQVPPPPEPRSADITRTLLGRALGSSAPPSLSNGHAVAESAPGSASPSSSPPSPPKTSGEAALEMLAAHLAMEKAAARLEVVPIPSPAATQVFMPMLEQAQRAGFNPLLPSSLFPKPADYVWQRPSTTGYAARPDSSTASSSSSGTLSPQAQQPESPTPLPTLLPPAARPSSALEQPIPEAPVAPFPPTSPLLKPLSSPKPSPSPHVPRGAASPLATLVARFAESHGLPNPFSSAATAAHTSSATPSPAAIAPSGRPYPAPPAFWDDSIGEWSSEGIKQPRPGTGILAVGVVRMVSVDYTPAAAAAAESSREAAERERIRLEKMGGRAAKMLKSSGGGRRSPSPGSPTAPATGDKAAAAAAMAAAATPSTTSATSPPYLVVVRRAQECELSGMVWRHPPEGLEATPFAIHMVSSKSGRGMVEFLRLADMRKSVNPIVVQTVALVDALEAKRRSEESGGGHSTAQESDAGSASALLQQSQGGHTHAKRAVEHCDSSDASPAMPTALPSSKRKQRHRDTASFSPPATLVPHITLMGLYPTACRKGLDRGPSTAPHRTSGPIPASVFLHDNPTTTLPAGPSKSAMHAPETASSFCLYLLAAALPSVAAAALPGSYVPPFRVDNGMKGPAAPPAPPPPFESPVSSSRPTAAAAEAAAAIGLDTSSIVSSRSGMESSILDLMASSSLGSKDFAEEHHQNPLKTLPQHSPSAARAYLCSSVGGVVPPPIRQPVFLVRTFNPASGKVGIQRHPSSSRSGGGGEGGGGEETVPEQEAWLTYPQLCHPSLGLHPSVIYAARCRFLAFAGFSCAQKERNGFRFTAGSLGSVPLAGAVQRLIPGHFLAGAGSLDRARGFVSDSRSEADTSIASMRLRKEARDAAGALRAWMGEKRRMEALFVERGLDPATLEFDPPPALTMVAPRERAALRMLDMRPVDTKAALEAHYSGPMIAAETAFASGRMGGGEGEEGLIARRLIVRADGSVLHCQLGAGFPEEQGKDESLVELEKKVAEQATRTGGKGDPALLALIEKFSGAHSSFMFSLRVYASNTGVVTNRWISVSQAMVPLRDPHAYDRGLPMDSDEIPGNPFLHVESLAALCGTPCAPREVAVVTRVCSAEDIQTWVCGEGKVGNIGEFSRHPLGLHASVPRGGCYLLSLWIRPNRDAEGGEGGAHQQQQQQQQQQQPGLDGPWEWREVEEGHPLTAALISTLTISQSYATAGRDAGQLNRFPKMRKQLPRFTLRAQYIRQPFCAWETPEEHDQRMKCVSGVRKSARMAMGEFKHWITTGNFPSSARLPQVVKPEHVFAAEFPHIKLQAWGNMQPWVEPAYAYRVGLEELRKPTLNPFLETMPTAPKQRARRSPSRTPSPSPPQTPSATSGGGKASAPTSPAPPNK